MKKRITALALALFILIVSISSISVSAETSGRLLGDTSNDGIVTIIDVTMIQRHLIQLVTIDDESTAAGDVDGNGILEIDDATLIQKWIAKMDVPYAIGEVMTEYGAQKQAAIDALSARLADTKADAGDLPVLIRSYDTYSLYLYNSAYTYDWVLVKTDSFLTLDDDRYGVFDDHVLYNNEYDPFNFGYGVIDCAGGTFYGITEAWNMDIRKSN